MRNLKLQFCKQIADTCTDVKYILMDPNDRLGDLVYLITANKIFEYRVSTTKGRVVADLTDEIVGAEYLALNNQICLARDEGQVLIFDAATDKLTEGTYCDVGIDTMCWSPDQEVVVFITKMQSVVVMTCTFETLTEQHLTEDCAGDGQFINVGWGKKETQFHGSEGKTAASVKSDFQPPTNVDELPKDIVVSWRADGAFFAVSFVSELGRMFKVYDREGALNFTSEKWNDLLPPLAWRPSGTWIAMPHRLPNKSTVALFEKNGLRHREIVLPFDLNNEPIVGLKWSPESDILIVETKNEAADRHSLYLYTIGNYHWYVKQVLHFKLSNPIAVYNWDSKIGEEKTLHVVLKNGKYVIYKWYLGVDKYERRGLVAVIDGQKLYLTDFSKNVIPPPMRNEDLQIDAYINTCAFRVDALNKEVHLLIYDSEFMIHTFRALFDTPTLFEKVSTVEPHAHFINTPNLLGTLFWYDENNVVAIHSTGTFSRVLLISIDNKESNYKSESSLDIRGVVNALVSGNGNGAVPSNKFFVQTSDGNVHQLSVQSENTMFIDKVYAQLKPPAYQFEWITTKTSSCLVSLKSNQCLYIDGKRIAEDVTSFSWAGEYLAFTKLGTLYFLNLRDKSIIISERKIERGGKLITITNNSRTILQMPRGNLETIYPRVLTFENISHLLATKQYRTAMIVLRNQRINLNILCDHNIRAFIENLNLFLKDLHADTNWLSVFLTDLENVDFTKTKYANFYKDHNQSYPKGFQIEHKVNYICDRLLELMDPIMDDTQHYRFPIITAYVKAGKAELALMRIWKERRHEIVKGQGDVKPSEDSLKYLLYLVDVNDLYNIALGTYELGLVLFVAEKSQKDPKEYLAYLNELKGYSASYRQFKIDEHLKRYTKALRNLSHCGVEKMAEALDFIKRHDLYREALYEYDQHTECQQQIALSYADYLRINGKFGDASVMYERGGNLSQALQSAKHVSDWERVLYLASKDGQDVTSVALSLVNPLMEAGKFKEAYTLLKIYGSDFTEAIKCLLKGNLFLKAIYEVQKEQSKNSKETIASITKELIKYTKKLECALSSDEELFASYKRRLLTVREDKAKRDQLAADGELNDVEVDECDLLSDTTSMRSSRYSGTSSQRTGKTFRSSKNRRKHERKLYSLKPGNPFEDIALIDALYNLIMDIVSKQQHISEISKALIEMKRDDVGSALQQGYKQLLVMVKASLDEIWIKELSTATQQYLSGPNVDYTQVQNEQRYALISPQKRVKPELIMSEWEHDILK